MSNVIGIVKNIIGTVKVTTPDGAVKILSQGDVIHENDQIDAMASSQATILLNNGKEIVIDSDTSIALNEDYINSYTPEVTLTDTETTIADVEKLLANDEEGTAAGQEGGTNTSGLSNAYYHDRLNSNDTNYELDRTGFSQNGQSSTDTANVNPADTDTNEALTLTVTPVTAEFIEDATNAGDTVATSSATDPDGTNITYTISDTTNYSIDATTGEVTLTQAGADIVNGGGNLPDFSVTATSQNGQSSTDTANVNPADTDTNEAPIAIDDPNIVGGLYVEYYGTPNHLSSISSANQIISNNDADATFISTDINYGYIDSNNDGNYDIGETIMSGNLVDGLDISAGEVVDSNLSDFIKSDSNTLEYNQDSINDGSLESATNGVLHITGILKIDNSGDYTFNINHDDGFELRIDGVSILSYDGNTGTRLSTVTLSLDAGQHDVEIVYWDQGGAYVLDLDLLDTNGTNVWVPENLSHNQTSANSTDEDTSIVVDVLANDFDMDGDVINITQIEGQDASSGQMIEIVKDGVVLGLAHVVDGKIEFVPVDGLDSLNDGENRDVVFEYTISDGNKTDTANVTINVTGTNDAPEVAPATADIYVPIDVIEVKNLEAGFDNAVFVGGTSTVNTISNDADSFIDGYRWGNAATGSGKSGYTLVDNSSYMGNGQEVSTGELINLGEFTHENWPIYANSSTLDTIDMKMNFDVVINGVSTTVSFTINIDHTETPNDGDDPRDIITLPTQTQIFDLNGQEYTVSIEGFRDSDGNPINTIYTQEQASNSYTVVGKITSTDTLPTITGQVLAEDAEDESVNVVWGDISSSHGTLTANDDGSYSFEVNRETKDALDPGETLTDTFNYSVTDSNGVTSSSTLTITIGGYDAINSDNNEFIGGSNNDMLKGTQLEDILIGNDGDDVLVYDGADTINAGTGEDTLLLDSDILLDFDGISDDISKIERIDLGEGDQDITLDLGDVIDITDSDSILDISGDTNDHVTLDGSDGVWEQVDTSSKAGFDQYTATDSNGNVATIFIEQEIQVDHS